MSDLTAENWSQQTTEKLRALEQTCEDADLFCIGYIIPQVELVEMANADAIGVEEAWFDALDDYLDESIEKDRLTEPDQNRVREIIQSIRTMTS